VYRCLACSGGLVAGRAAIPPLFQKAGGKKVPQVPVEGGPVNLESLLQRAWRNRLSRCQDLAQERLMTGRQWVERHRAANRINFIKLVIRGDFERDLIH